MIMRLVFLFSVCACFQAGAQQPYGINGATTTNLPLLLFQRGPGQSFESAPLRDLKQIEISYQKRSNRNQNSSSKYILKFGTNSGEVRTYTVGSESDLGKQIENLLRLSGFLFDQQVDTWVPPFSIAIQSLPGAKLCEMVYGELNLEVLTQQGMKEVFNLGCTFNRTTQPQEGSLDDAIYPSFYSKIHEFYIDNLRSP